MRTFTNPRNCKRSSSFLSVMTQLNCKITTRASLPTSRSLREQTTKTILLVVTVLIVLVLFDCFPPFQERYHHRWDLPVLRYHKIMVIYPYPFLVVITQLFSWITFINDCICILTGSPGSYLLMIIYVIH